jgi:hypothetical protein
MRPALFRTRITEMLGIRHPILAGVWGRESPMRAMSRPS